VLRFKLVSLSGVQFDEEVYEVLLPTMEGTIGVLAGHMPLVSVAKTGVISVRRSAKDPSSALEYFACSGGVIEVAGGELSVLVDEADPADDINEAEAQAAYDRAQAMKAEATDEVSLERAQQMVDRHAVRLQVSSLKRRHSGRR
jgi:F-type H+-transporting ATPase subunit epsilon